MKPQNHLNRVILRFFHFILTCERTLLALSKQKNKCSPYLLTITVGYPALFSRCSMAAASSSVSKLPTCTRKNLS